MGWCQRLCKTVGVVVGVILGVVLLLFLVAVIRAATIEEPDYQVVGLETGVIEEVPQWYLDGLPQIMAQALSIPTISTAPGEYDTEQILKFHDFLRESFPNVFNSSFIHVEIVNTYSFLFTITGTDNTIQPYMLAAHMDVVPVDASKWTIDPFGGHISPDATTGVDYIWGRGAIDNKSGVMGILMALEYLASSGFAPTRSFYVGLGHDEEVYGNDGAKHMGLLLAERKVTLDFLLDEGLMILEDTMPGVEEPIALIGVTEKGSMRVRLEVEGEGGHSSMPPKDQAVTRLASAIYKLHTYPQPSMFGQGPEADLFSYMAPKTSWPYKMVYANTWLFRPVLEAVMSAKRETNSLIRTTTAATIVRAGVKENVIPSSGWAIVNHRVHPAQTVDEVMEYNRRVINDPSVKLTVEDHRLPHPVSPYGPDVPGWRLLFAATNHIFPGTAVVPGILMGNTDTVHYMSLTRCIYRYLPLMTSPREVTTIHGHDERISVTNVKNSVRFYHHLILSADLGPKPLRTPTGHRAGEF